MTAAGCTDVGKVRNQNQDAIFISAEPIGPLPNLFILADGMGGHKAGDVASASAVACFCENIRARAPEGEGFLDMLMDAATAANRLVFEKSLADESFTGMGTTLTACVISGGKCEIVHIGDSRAYKIVNGSIIQVTNDHSYVNEMIKAKQITPQEARKHPKRNVLTRVLGVGFEMEADGYVCETEPGGFILLCSDGLTDMLTDDVILETVSGNAPAEEKARALIARANGQGGLDNISVVLIEM